MEVHTHTHSERKKWFHYLWEFLMLFLAVFCGFLAEYQLEHKIEKEKAHEYIRSFYEDLLSDTSSYNIYIQYYEDKMAALKKADSCYDMFTQHKNCDSCLSDLMDNAYSFIDMVTQDRTLIQLKNAGGLRLLEKNDADSILSYDQLIRISTISETTGYQEQQYKLRDVINSLSNYGHLKSGGRKSTVPLLYKADPEAINYFFVLLQSYTGASLYKIENLKKLRQKAVTLIKYFKTKYNFQ